jgi:excisionase family DNA binding protein
MKTINDTDKFLSLAQVAKHLKISRIAVYKRIKSGSLRALRVGRSYIVQADILKPKEPAERISFSGLYPNARLAQALKQAVWDYRVTPHKAWEILRGKKTTFSLNQQKLCARLLTTVDWYTLVDIFGTRNLYLMINDEVLKNIWNDDMKKRLIYARSVLNEQ